MKIQVFLKISVLKNFANFSGFPPAFGNICVAERPATCNFIKKRLQHKCFPVKFLRAHFCTEQLLWLLFKISNIDNLFKDFSVISLTKLQVTISDNLQLSQ